MNPSSFYPSVFLVRSEWIDKEEMASAAAAANVVKLFVEIEAAIADENNGKVLELANQGK